MTSNKCRDNKLGGVEGFKTPVLAHFDPPHDTRAPLSSSDPTPMVVRLRRGCSGYRVGWWGVAHGAEYAFLPQVLVKKVEMLELKISPAKEKKKHGSDFVWRY